MTSGHPSSPVIIGGRYRVQKSLASGAMGQVLVAWDQVLERQVAVKTLLPERCESPRAQLRFVDEAHINAQLQHPGIVAAHELGRQGNQLYLVMRLVEGENMAQLLLRLRGGSAEDRQAWPLARRLRLCLDLCQTLAFAHDRGVIHRDLKPANILLEHGSEVVVSDWGLAKVIGDSAFADAAAPEVGLGRLAGTGSSDDGSSADLTVEGRVVGTPIYMAPEQAEGRRNLDRRADVYSLGAVLYELITLERPYSGHTHYVLQAKFKRPPPKPSWVVDCPPALDAIVGHAMATDRMLRYRDASELANDLAAFLDGRSVSSYQETLLEGVERLSHRYRTAVLTAVAAMVTIAILTVAAGAWLRHERLNVAARAEDHEIARRLAATASRNARHVRQQAEASTALATRTSDLLTTIANLERLARRATAIDRLVSLHASARRQLVVGLEPSPLTAAPHPLEPLAVQREALGALGLSLDLVIARALIRRAPRRALELLDGLDLGTEAPLLRARALLRLRRTPEALALLAQRASPASSPALAALAAQYQPLPAEERVAAFDRAIAAQPRGWLYTRRAECRVAAGDLEGAWRDYDLAARLEPTDPFIYISRLRNATFPYANHIVIDAWESLVGQLTDDVGDLPAIAGRLYLWKGIINLSRFTAVIKKAVEEDQLSQQDGDARLSRGALIVNQLDKAEHHARSALSRPGDRRLAMGCLAEVALRRGLWGEAERLAREGLERFGRHPRLRFVLGEALRRRGRPAEALDHLRAGARPSLDPVRWERLARCLAQLDDPGGWQEGLQAAHLALSMDAYGDLDGSPDGYPEAGTPIYNRTLSKLHHRRAETGLAILHSVRALVCAERLASRRGVDLQDALVLGGLHEELGLVAEARLFYDDARPDPRVKHRAEAHLDRLRPR